MPANSKRSGCLRMIGVAIGAIIVIFVAYRIVILPWMNTWGATAEEIRVTLPGDELVLNPVSQTTQGVTIHAKPEQIYPWLLQIGVDRGGMYSYDWLENLMGLNVHTIDRVVPEFQNVKPGDFWRFTPKDYIIPDGPGVHVMRLEPNRAVKRGARQVINLPRIVLGLIDRFSPAEAMAATVCKPKPNNVLS